MAFIPGSLEPLGQQIPDFRAPVLVVGQLLEHLLQIEALGILGRLSTRVADVALSVQPEEEM